VIETGCHPELITEFNEGLWAALDQCILKSKQAFRFEEEEQRNE
jgi:hypothetical protein